jgi:hypothetical protein
LDFDWSMVNLNANQAAARFNHSDHHFEAYKPRLQFDCVAARATQ